MNKKLTTLLLIFTLLLALLITPAAYADPSTNNEQNSALTEYVFGNDNMNISLPADWYINTPDEIDSDFLQVTENTERRLKKYLEYSDIEFNLLSKDLKQEINVILVHNSRTKMMFDFNIIDESSLSEQGQVFVDQGAQESDSGSMTYESFVIKRLTTANSSFLMASLKMLTAKALLDSTQLPLTDTESLLAAEYITVTILLAVL